MISSHFATKKQVSFSSSCQLSPTRGFLHVNTTNKAKVGARRTQTTQPCTQPTKETTVAILVCCHLSLNSAFSCETDIEYCPTHQRYNRKTNKTHSFSTFLTRTALCFQTSTCTRGHTSTNDNSKENRNVKSYLGLIVSFKSPSSSTHLSVFFLSITCRENNLPLTTSFDLHSCRSTNAKDKEAPASRFLPFSPAANLSFLGEANRVTRSCQSLSIHFFFFHLNCACSSFAFLKC